MRYFKHIWPIIIVLALILALVPLGCVEPPPDIDVPITPIVPEETPRVAYLPDGRMVLLQTSGEDEEVVFQDTALESAIRQELENQIGVLSSEPIRTTDLERLVSLTANARNITNIEGLEYCINLCYVSLSSNRISDISSLGSLPGGLIYVQDTEETYRLLDLALSENCIRDLTPLSGLSIPNELALGLSGNQISDLSPLANLHNLLALSLNCNNISDISPLAELTNLGRLDLWGNSIVDISPLWYLTDLVWIELSGNRIVNMLPISDLVNLEKISLVENKITCLPALPNLSKLELLDLRWNLITDASNITTLPPTCEVRLEGNPLR